MCQFRYVLITGFRLLANPCFCFNGDPSIMSISQIVGDGNGTLQHGMLSKDLQYLFVVVTIRVFVVLFQVNSVRLPRHVADKKAFCGTALVEFSTVEDAEKILNESLIYAGAKLDLKPK